METLTEARIVTSAISGLIPSATKDSLTFKKSVGLVIISIDPSSLDSISSAPASIAISIVWFLLSTVVSVTNPTFSKRYETDPSDPRFPPNLDKACLTSATVRLRLSVIHSIRMAAPPGP